MTPTPVGMRCPECSQQKTQVRNLRSMHVNPVATYVLIAINVAIFIGVRSNYEIFDQLVLTPLTQYPDGSLHGILTDEYWRLLTAAFLHQDWWHVGMNMLSLYFLGQMIEPALGHARFLAIYFTSAFFGSLAVVLMDQAAYGASGAVYGLLGAAIVMARNRQISLIQSGLVPILVLNFVITLYYDFSLAGHVGGLIGGLVSTFVVEELARRRRDSFVPAIVSCVVLSVGAIIAAIAIGY
jgi:membrane associated rhomboid family serine protease